MVKAMKRIILSMLIAVAMTLTLAACSEGGTPTRSDAPTGTSEAAKPTEPTGTEGETPNEIRIDTEFLDEFGMTLSEIESRRGNAISGTERVIGDRIEEYIYFFERGNDRGYSFSLEYSDWTPDNQRRLPDGTARVDDTDRRGARIEFRRFSGQASNLFLGMEGEIYVDDIKKIVGIEFGTDWNGEPVFYSSYSPPISAELDPYYGGHDGFWMTTFWLDKEFVVVLIHDKESLIQLNSKLEMSYFPQGVGRQ